MIAFSVVWIPVALSMIYFAWLFWPRDQVDHFGLGLMFRLLGLIPILLLWLAFFAWRAWGLS